jgi:8-oxo-dGTP pyrophosphatase MutT (NUDIX family)
MQKRPDVSLKLVLRAEGRVLMLHRTAGTWEFPGGRLEWGESPEEAINRELIEELGYKVPATPKFIHVYNYISNDKTRHSILLHYFLAIEYIPELHATPEEPEPEVVWLTKADLSRIIPNPEFIEQIFAYNHRQ